MDKIRRFEEKDIANLYDAFLDAFSDYHVKIRMPFVHFKIRMLEKLHLYPPASALYWEAEKIVGFLMHAYNHYQGVKTAYNGGTGVVRGRRGEGITLRLYEHVLQQMRADQIEQVVLEVVTGNKPAINVYTTFGFTPSRLFRCFRLIKKKLPPNDQIHLVRSEEWNENYQHFWDYEPSFLDQSQQLVYNLSNEIIIEAYAREKLIGYCVFQPHLGRISQLAVDKAHRGLKVGSGLLAEVQLLSSVKSLTLMNVPEKELGMIGFLLRIGFVNEIDQLEMKLKI